MTDSDEERREKLQKAGITIMMCGILGVIVGTAVTIIGFIGLILVIAMSSCQM